MSRPQTTREHSDLAFASCLTIVSCIADHCVRKLRHHRVLHSRPLCYPEPFHTQFQRDTLPWLEDLLIPLVSGPPGPLTDTRSPREIADIDSRFAEVNDIDLHYKVCTQHHITCCPCVSMQRSVCYML